MFFITRKWRQAKREDMRVQRMLKEKLDKLDKLSRKECHEHFI